MVERIAPGTMPTSLTDAEAKQIRALARDAINHGLSHHRERMTIEENNWPPYIRSWCATFVTLRTGTQLRGCVGSITPRWSMGRDIIQNAHSAAFEDPRFAPLAREELEMLSISISLLSSPAKLETKSEADLLNILRPGTDGLILKYKNRSATLLPSVWAGVRSPSEFLENLKLKAGLPKHFWSEGLEFHRYTVESY